MEAKANQDRHMWKMRVERDTGHVHTHAEKVSRRDSTEIIGKERREKRPEEDDYK